MVSLSTCHLGLWLGWQIFLNLVKNPNIDTDIFSLAEVNIAIKQMKHGKAPGLDGIHIEV